MHPSTQSHKRIFPSQPAVATRDGSMGCHARSLSTPLCAGNAFTTRDRSHSHIHSCRTVSHHNMQYAQASPYLAVDVAREDVLHVGGHGDAARVTRIQVACEALLLVELEAILRTVAEDLE